MEKLLSDAIDAIIDRNIKYVLYEGYDVDRGLLKAEIVELIKDLLVLSSTNGINKDYNE